MVSFLNHHFWVTGLLPNDHCNVWPQIWTSFQLKTFSQAEVHCLDIWGIIHHQPLLKIQVNFQTDNIA